MTHRQLDLMGGRRIVHGTPITPNHLLDSLAGGSFCVSFARPDQLERCIRLVGGDEVLILDNGAYSHWKQGRGAIDREAFWDWANEIQWRCPNAIAVIPDVIEGHENDNVAEMSWALREGLADYPGRTMSIWHMNETQPYLMMQLELMNFVGIGSCVEFDVQRNRTGYLEMLEQVRLSRDVVNRLYDRHPWIHLMRGLGVFKDVAWADSADSTNVAVNSSRLKGLCGRLRASELARRIEKPIQAAARAIPVRRKSR